MVNILLASSCTDASNITVSSNRSVAKFNAVGTLFPFKDGLVLRSGEVEYTEGKYTGINLDSQINTNSDAYLKDIYQELSGALSTITDVAFLEFDFVPIFNNLELDFIFASNEYGEWQCGFGDVFAFLLTDLTTNITTNLAVLDDTETPVSVSTVRDVRYNASCESQNSELFSTYNVINHDVSFMNMRGYTKAIKAFSDVIPNRSYRIRLVIADVNDSRYDSAVFINSGSFDIAFDLGEDKELCDGDYIEINTDFDADIYVHDWYFNGIIIPHENKSVLTIYEPGTYSVRLTKKGTSCIITDDIVISELQVIPPKDLRVCNSGEKNYRFNLEQNNAKALGLDEDKYEVYYYMELTPVDVSIDTAIKQDKSISYSSIGNESIYVKIWNKKTNRFCEAIYVFDLIIAKDFTISIPDDILVCDDGLSHFVNFTDRNDQILGTLSESNYDIYYYASADDELNNTPIIDPTNYLFSNDLGTQNIWVRVVNKQFPECYVVTSFAINIVGLPQVDVLEDVIACSMYQLPALSHGMYYDAPNGFKGTGVMLPEGYIVETSGVYYIYEEPNVQGCSNESNFKVTIIDEYDMPLDFCESLTIPPVIEGAFYTALDGYDGDAEIIPSGTVINTSQTIFFYAEHDGVFCTEKQFDITIHDRPMVDDIEDVVLCTGDTYVLRSLTEAYNSYFINGYETMAGEVISETTEVTIFADDGFCTNQTSFMVTFVPAVNNIENCGSYKLPNLSVANYYTQPFGQGTIIPDGSLINESQTLYVYSEYASCTDNLSFDVTIKSIPRVDTIPDVRLCEAEVYILPTLNYGNYFTGTSGTGNALFPGDVITETQTIYIYALLDDCSNQTDFQVEIREKPQVDSFNDIYTCGSYALPSLSHGLYYTKSGGQGEQLFAGKIISETQTIYIYNSYEDIKGCDNEKFFTVYCMGVSLGDDDFNDVYVCDSYILPKLSIGAYYSRPNGEGERIPELSVITETQTVYVFIEKTDGRNSCSDEEDILITIAKTPVLPVYEDIVVCGHYILPTLNFDTTFLDSDMYDLSYYRKSGGDDKISISEYSIDTPGSYNIYVRATAKNNSDCYDEVSFLVQIYPLLDLNIENQFLCLDPDSGIAEEPVTLSTNLNSEAYDVFWYLNDELVGEGVSYNTKTPGVYFVETIKKIPDVVPNCSYKASRVQVYSIKTIAKANVTDDFANNAIITIEITEQDFGDYQFQLNDRLYQDSNIFDNVSSGEHTIKIKSLQGNCTPLLLHVMVLKYPKFFTPNQDGFNDTWNIKDLYEEKYQAVISIYDRYNKLIKQIQPSGSGWDGTFNGRNLPSNDFWFVVNYLNDAGVSKQYRSNFSLIR
ncbi:choice-of-anchor L domain-containing protein [Thalassobellus citreus]|uniref:T9SS type B sorting domain-containing protein n=1 Tax=Thalassobellus citreus TaxID=3367752 RepID=UPI0037912199